MVELGPEPTIVPNDGRSAPFRRKVYSISPWISYSPASGRTARIASFCASTVTSTARRMQASSSGVLVPRSCWIARVASVRVIVAFFFLSSAPAASSPKVKTLLDRRASESSTFANSDKGRPIVLVTSPAFWGPNRLPVHTSRPGFFSSVKRYSIWVAPSFTTTSFAPGSRNPVRYSKSGVCQKER